MKAGWQVKKLSEICNIVNGSTPLRSKKEFWDYGTIEWFTIEDIREQGRKIKQTKQKVTETALKETSLRILPINSVLLCCTASIGEHAIAQIPLATNQQFNGLVVKDKSSLNPYFLFHFCATLKDVLSNLSGKTTIDFIPISRLKEIAIPLPPIQEQQRIVAILDQAFEGIAKARANAEQNLQNARALFESHLQSVFSVRGERIEPHHPSTSSGRAIECWVEKSLSEACEIKPPKNEAKMLLKNIDFVSFAPMEDLGINQKYLTPKKQRTLEDVAGSYTYFAEGDVLLAKITPCFENGKLGIARNLINGIGFGSSEYIVFRPNKELSNEFLYYFLSRKRFIEEGAVRMSGAVGHKRVSKEFIEDYKIAFPLLDIQKEIVRKIDDLSKETQRLETLYQRKIACLDELKKSLLQQAFAGEL